MVNDILIFRFHFTLLVWIWPLMIRFCLLVAGLRSSSNKRENYVMELYIISGYSIIRGCYDTCMCVVLKINLTNQSIIQAFSMAYLICCSSPFLSYKQSSLLLVKILPEQNIFLILVNLVAPFLLKLNWLETLVLYTSFFPIRLYKSHLSCHYQILENKSRMRQELR